jgi:hypothetical protein
MARFRDILKSFPNACGIGGLAPLERQRKVRISSGAPPRYKTANANRSRFYARGGRDNLAELIAAKRATARKVPQIAFRPDWTKYAKAAPFKRNDAMLQILRSA